MNPPNDLPTDRPGILPDEPPALSPPDPSSGQPHGTSRDRKPTTRSRRLIAGLGVLAAVLLVGGIAAIAISRFPAAPSPGPSAPAVASTGLPASSAGPASTPPSSAAASSSPGPTPAVSTHPASIEEQVREVEAQVPPLRGLEALRDVPNHVLDEAALRADITRRFDEENPPDRLRAEQALLERLGYVEPGADLRALYLDAMSTQVLGFYDDESDAMNLVQRDGEFGPLERLTLAHEYTHALQDQHFDLGAITVDDPDQSDRAVARMALVEGDASLLMALWAQRYLTSDELGDVVAQSSDPAAQEALDRLPLVLRVQLMFPYESGLLLATRIYASGQWAGIDDAYGRPPETTEQVLHPDKYESGEGPVEVTLPPIAEQLGPGWRQSAADTAGELGLRSWLETAGVDAAAEAAAGWAGDRAASYDGPGGAWAAVWVTSWDSIADASEFRSAADVAVETRANAAVGLSADGNGVAIAIASDAATVGDLARMLGIGQ